MGKASRRRKAKQGIGYTDHNLKLATLFSNLTMNGVLFQKSITHAAMWNRALYNAEHGEFESFAHLRMDGDEYLIIYDSKKQSPVDILGDPAVPHPADKV